jgi:hypothetical protein
MKWTRREQLAYILGLIEVSTVHGHGTKLAVKFAIEKGIERNMHLNKQGFLEEDPDNRVPEYLMGQLVDMYEDDNYIALNTFNNLGRSHLEGGFGYE